MIKVLAPAQRHPTNRTLGEFHHYWAESHGPLFANTKSLRRYVQHLTLREAYDLEPAPTFDGISMFWYDDFRARRVATDDPEILALLEGSRGVSLRPQPDEPAPQPVPEVVALLRAVLEDDAQLFDRSTGWPRHRRAAAIAAEERIILDGTTAPQMVKAIFIASKLPGLTLEQFFDRWEHHHAALAAKLPGLRRYVQNHALPEAYADRGQTHDGWSEFWFDDLGALRRALTSPDWQVVQEDGATLFGPPLGVGVARERIQKDSDWIYNDWGANALSEKEIASRLAAQGYAALATDPETPRRLKMAADGQALAVWTDEHLVTIDPSRIDARPSLNGSSR
jgi:uncharacterized protein (TIGR02118 family)